MARRKPPPPPDQRGAGGVPPELAAGPCLELWADDTRTPWPAVRAYAAARWQWASSHQPPVSPAEALRLLPCRAPYSARYLAEHGREDEARRLLGPMACAVLGPWTGGSLMR